MRFLVLGNFTPGHSTEGYVADALAAEGHEAVRVQEDETTPGDLVARISDLGPDVLLSSKFELRGLPFREVRSDQSPLVTVLRVLRRTFPRLTVAAWLFDLMRREFRPDRYEWSRRVSAGCHRFFCTDSVLAADPNVTNGRLLRQGYPGPTDPDTCPNCDGYGEGIEGLKGAAFECPDCHGSGVVSRPVPTTNYECDVLFLGDNYGGRRVWLRELQRAFGPRLRWVRSGVHCDELFYAMRSARVVVGPPYPYFPGYWSNRIYLTAGYGGLYAGPGVEGMADEGWLAGVNYVNTGLTAGTQVEVLRAVLRHYDDWEHVRGAGVRHCRENLTFRHRVRELVRELETVNPEAETWTN